jgi:hypothetical protein
VRSDGARVEFEGKTVTGAPYTAQAVTETTQVLGDGTRIAHKSSGFVARDSAGRTRREQTLDFVGPWASSGEPSSMIFVHDPVAGTSFSIDAKSKTAMKPGPTTFSAQGVQELKAKLKAELGHIQAGAVQISDEPSGNVTHESLGTQTIEGVLAEGKRVTETIPAGKIGNDKPIQIVNETWYSTELKTVVMSKHSDPRTGDVTYSLTNINRTEPDASLFQIPSDYEVREPQTFEFHVAR